MTFTQWQTPADEPVVVERLEDRADSVGDMLRRRIAKTPDGTAYMFPDASEEWQSLTWREVGDRVWRLSAGLISLGVEAEQRVAIASGTRYEWALADLATNCAGAATTTIYPTTISDDVAFIISDSDSVVVFAEDSAQVAKLLDIREAIPQVRKVVTFDDTDLGGDWVMTLADLDALGGQALSDDPEVVDRRIDAITPDQLATLIYTSGTTGRPKGVRLLNDTWSYQGSAVHAIDLLDESDLQYLWLPLAHVFGKQLLTIPLQIGFPTAIDGRIDKIVDNLAVVRPTFMAAAPRVFEKVYGKVTLGVAQQGGVKEKLFNWATAVGSEVGEAQLQGRTAGGLLGVKHGIADKLVLSKVRDRFGGRIRFFISGSAALNADVARWFNGVGLKIAEGYGLTETSSAACVNRLNAFQIGKVGWPLPGTEVKIAEDGEVLLKGPGVMAGYHNNPEATAEVLNADGYFHTGDIGEVDERGFLKITDRKKDLFKTSNGKYVAPSLIESKFKGLNPYASQFIVIGNGRNFVSALVTLDEEAIAPWAEANGLGGKSYTEIVSSPQARDMVQSYVDQLNADLNRWEQIKKFTILGRDLTIEDGELTPSLKLKRKIVSDKFQDEIDAFYADA